MFVESMSGSISTKETLSDDLPPPPLISFSICYKTARARGVIIAVVAVLETHIDRILNLGLVIQLEILLTRKIIKRAYLKKQSKTETGFLHFHQYTIPPP